MTDRASDRRPEPEIITEPWRGRGGRWPMSVGGGRSFPWPGVFLVLIGLGLLIRQVEPRVGIGTIILLALGLSFALHWVVTRSSWPLVPAFLLVALAFGRLLGELGLVRGDGPTALLLGIGMLAVWGYARSQGRPLGWALWLGAILALIGFVQLTDTLPGLPDIGGLWPLVVVGVGIALIAGSTMGRDRLGRGWERRR